MSDICTKLHAISEIEATLKASIYLPDEHQLDFIQNRIEKIDNVKSITEIKEFMEKALNLKTKQEIVSFIEEVKNYRLSLLVLK